MGEGPVTAPTRKRRPPWKLKPPHDALTQGIVVSGFGHLPAAEALFLHCEPETGAAAAGEGQEGANAWLRTLSRVAPISDADGKDERATAIAFTWTGLQALGLPPDVLATFSAPFREGMYQEDRLRRLGDTLDDQWQPTVIDGGPRWSGNTPPRRFRRPDPDKLGFVAAEAPAERDDRHVVTPLTVHALVVLYDKDETSVDRWAAEVEDALASHRVRVVHRLSLDLRLDENGIGREHFGFADALSQPIPYNEDTGDDTSERVVLIDGAPAERDKWHGVPLGEILLGHTNGHHEKAPGPAVPDDAKARAAALTSEGAPAGFCNFGLHGSYLVVRELRQDVAAFWTSMKEGAARIRAHDPSATFADADWLSERIIGRNIDGHLLCPSGFLAKDEYNHPQNAFGFARSDPHGHGCPPGSHVRRANPRDGLAPDEASAQTLLDAANNHRILRRGRKYGTTVGRDEPPDGEERGLLFMCLNTDIARQFEFVQQTWLLNRNFATLFDETDPLVGPKGRFTIREQPLRRIVEVETFVRLAGGEYFFLPSIPAFNYLAAS
jgi:deferrochelatase/peroxidase EfeB